VTRKKREDPNSTELLAVARIIADTLLATGQLNPSPELLADLKDARLEELRWQEK
jgi:hypothetical protein